MSERTHTDDITIRSHHRNSLQQMFTLIAIHNDTALCFQLPWSAITPGEYVEYFRQWVEDGYQVVHINLGSNLSSAYQNCCIAAEELGNVYPVDSCNLSTGMGLLVIEAAERIAQGMDGRQIQQEAVYTVSTLPG